MTTLEIRPQSHNWDNLKLRLNAHNLHSNYNQIKHGPLNKLGPRSHINWTPFHKPTYKYNDPFNSNRTHVKTMSMNMNMWGTRLSLRLSSTSTHKHQTRHACIHVRSAEIAQYTKGRRKNNNNYYYKKK